MNVFHRICILQSVYTTKLSAIILQKNYIHSQIRVRFAPSPTGFLHLGGFRTAFYNYLFSKKHSGRFILRIEDTDSSRTVIGAASELEDNLKWLFIEPDESPRKGGPYGPYLQSERQQIYNKYSKLLLKNGSAYKCFCSNDRINSLKENKMPYDNKCRNLSLEEITRFEKENVPFCVRLKMKKEVIHLNDLVYGKREFKPVEQEGDFVILKTDGMPTYHFANVVDDHLMKITHVLRGSEWLPSIPKHLQLYRCFDWDPPIFAHLPTILNTDGTKLSKRQKDLHVKHFQQEGYSPEAILNIIKLSGGGFANYEHDKLSTMEELINQVITWGLERISKLNDFTSSDFHFIWVHPTVTKSDVDSFSFDARTVLVDLRNSLQNIQPQNFMKEAINEAIKEVQMKHNLKTNKMMKLIRLVVCGLKDGPPIVESFLLAGKDNVIHRLQATSVL